MNMNKYELEAVDLVILVLQVLELGQIANDGANEQFDFEKQPPLGLHWEMQQLNGSPAIRITEAMKSEAVALTADDPDITRYFPIVTC